MAAAGIVALSAARLSGAAGTGVEGSQAEAHRACRRILLHQQGRANLARKPQEVAGCDRGGRSGLRCERGKPAAALAVGLSTAAHAGHAVAVAATQGMQAAANASSRQGSEMKKKEGSLVSCSTSAARRPAPSSDSTRR